MENVDATVEENIRKLMPDLVGPILRAARFVDIGMDSMTMVELVLKLEAEFNVEIPDDLHGIHRIQDVVDYLESAVRFKGSGGSSLPGKNEFPSRIAKLSPSEEG
jgi:acyl carrier protein